MAVHRQNSWGRTRSRKNLAGSQCGTVTPVEALSSLAGVTAATSGVQGYATENQRFMHLFVKENSTSNKSINVYGYNYAFGEWAPLFLNLGGGSMTAVNCPSGTSANEGQLFIIDVSGVDRVGFFQTETDAPDRLRCAFTTF